MNVKYYSIIKRKGVKSFYVNINAKGLKWNIPNFQVATGETVRLKAENLIQDAIEIWSKNPMEIDVKRTLAFLKSGKDETPEIFSVQTMIDDFIDNKKISKCESCKEAQNHGDTFDRLFKHQVVAKPVKKSCADCELGPEQMRKYKSFLCRKNSLSHFTKFDSSVPAQILDVNYLERYIDFMRDGKQNGVKDYSDATIKTSIDYFLASLLFAIKKNKVQRKSNIECVFDYKNDIKIDCKLEPNERDDTFSDEKIENVLSYTKSKSLQLMIDIARKFPTRWTELRELRLDAFSIKGDKGFLAFRTVFKHGIKREFGIDNELTQRLNELKESKSDKCKFFFTDKNEKLLSENKLRYEFEYARDKAQVKSVFHQLRIKATTDMFSAGIDLKTIQLIGGWKTEKMCLRYYKPKKVTLENVCDVMENFRVQNQNS